MRTKEEILASTFDIPSDNTHYADAQVRILEVLIDIRDELIKSNYPVIVGEEQEVFSTTRTPHITTTGDPTSPTTEFNS